MILALSSLWLLCSEARKCFWLYLLWWKTRQQPQWIRTLVIRKSGNPKVQMTCGCVLMRWVFVCCLVTGPFSFPGFAGNSSQSFNCRRQCRECFYFLGSNGGGNWRRGGRHFFCKELVWLCMIRFVNSCFGSRTLCTEFRVKGRYPYGLKLKSQNRRDKAQTIFFDIFADTKWFWLKALCGCFVREPGHVSDFTSCGGRPASSRSKSGEEPCFVFFLLGFEENPGFVVLVLQEATHILAVPGNLTPPVPHVTWIMSAGKERGDVDNKCCANTRPTYVDSHVSMEVSPFWK